MAQGPPTPQWYDAWDAADPAAHEDLQRDGLRESVEAVRRVLAAEARTLGGRWDRVLLGGIGQGAATAAHALLNLDIPAGPDGDVGDDDGRAAAKGPRLGGFMGFSGMMPFAGRSLADTRAVLGLWEGGGGEGGGDVVANTPVLLEHSAHDARLPAALGRALRDTLAGLGAAVEWCEYADGGHWLNSPRGIDDVEAFLDRTCGLRVSPSALGSAVRAGGF